MKNMGILNCSSFTSIAKIARKWNRFSSSNPNLILLQTECYLTKLCIFHCIRLTPLCSHKIFEEQILCEHQYCSHFVSRLLVSLLRMWFNLGFWVFEFSFRLWLCPYSASLISDSRECEFTARKLIFKEYIS